MWDTWSLFVHIHQLCMLTMSIFQCLLSVVVKHGVILPVKCYKVDWRKQCNLKVSTCIRYQHVIYVYNLNLTQTCNFSSASGSISITQVPSNIVNSGMAVQLECVGFSNSVKRVEWIRHTIVYQESQFLINNVTSDDEGFYTCKVTYEDDTFQTMDWTLNIKCKLYLVFL